MNHSAKTLSLAGAATVVAALAVPRTAHALGPVDLEIAARAGYATSPDSSFAANPLGLGFGGRAGISILGIYGGISGMYYLGGSQSVGPVSVSYSTVMYGGEVGYTLPIPVVKIRPQVGFGNQAISVGSASDSNLYLEPGVLVMIPVGMWIFGVDGNALILPSVSQGNALGQSSSKTYVSPTFHAQVGVKF